MTTARDIITKALQKNGVLTKGEVPDGDEINDGLDSLNALLQSWANDTLLIYYQASINFPLQAGVFTYTIGPSGAFNTERPLQIVSAYARQGQIDYPLTIINGENYDLAIRYKDLSGIPEVLFYDNNYPLGTITIYPVPEAAYTLFMRVENVLQSFPTLDTDVSLPPGWERALIYNLAMEMAPEYGQPVSQELLLLANNSMGKIKRATAKARNMDYPTTGGYNNNIFSGWRT